ncbi:MAG: HlyD family efflux transporter periplasmic adaptor subunit [Spirochaetota bacterium]
MAIAEKIKNFWSNRYARYGSIIALLVVSLLLFYRKPPVPTEIHTVTRGVYEASIEEDGITRVKERFTVFSPAAGVMMRVEKHAGDAVKKGELLTHVMLDYMRPVRSPATGTILKVHRESEGPIDMGMPILDVGDTNQLEIVSEVLTRDAVAVKPGNDAVISGWGGGTLKGKIRLVEPAAFTKVSTLGVEEQRVRVLVDFDKPKEMGEGFQVRCRIITKRREGSVTVPVGALFRSGNDWALYRVSKDRAQKAVVKIAETSGNTALVESGLAEGDRVVLFPGEKIRDGVKVKN